MRWELSERERQGRGLRGEADREPSVGVGAALQNDELEWSLSLQVQFVAGELH